MTVPYRRVAVELVNIPGAEESLGFAIHHLLHFQSTQYSLPTSPVHFADNRILLAWARVVHYQQIFAPRYHFRRR